MSTTAAHFSSNTNSTGNRRTLEQQQGQSVAHKSQIISSSARTVSANLNLQFPLEHWEEPKGARDMERGGPSPIIDHISWWSGHHLLQRKICSSVPFCYHTTQCLPASFCFHESQTFQGGYGSFLSGPTHYASLDGLIFSSIIPPPREIFA